MKLRAPRVAWLEVLLLFSRLRAGRHWEALWTGCVLHGAVSGGVPRTPAAWGRLHVVQGGWPEGMSFGPVVSKPCPKENWDPAWKKTCKVGLGGIIVVVIVAVVVVVKNRQRHLYRQRKHK